MRGLISGLTIESDLELPGADAAHAEAGTCLSIVHAGSRPVPPEPAPGELLQRAFSRNGPLYSTSRDVGDTVTLRIHGRADFEISPDRRRVRAFSDPACAPELLGLLASGNLLAMVLALRGETVLHASAVELAGRAVAFVAPSGAGKSTLAALACGRGARFVTDDLLRTAQSPEGGTSCLRGPTHNRLRSGAACLAGTQQAARRTSVDGRTVWQPPPSSAYSCALAAIVLPRPVRNRTTLRLHRLEPGAAVLELTRRPRLLGWIDSEIRQRTFTNLCRVASTVPVYHANVPWGPPFEASVTDALVELSRDSAHPPRAGAGLLG